MASAQLWASWAPSRLTSSLARSAPFLCASVSAAGSILLRVLTGPGNVKLLADRWRLIRAIQAVCFNCHRTSFPCSGPFALLCDQSI